MFICWSQTGADGCMSFIHRPQFNSSPLKNGLLEDYFPFKMVNLQGRAVKFGGGMLSV